MKRLSEPLIYEIEIKKSRFICYLHHIDDDAQAKAFIETIKLEHPKANHHCVAYVIKKDTIFRFDDDNEPQHTAGKVMLNVLIKQDLDHLLAVVVRYFGGIKLGRGGLVKAYTASVSEALQEAIFEPLSLKYRFSFKCPFEYAPAIEAYGHHIQSEVQAHYQSDHVAFEMILNDLGDLQAQFDHLSKGSVYDVEINSFYE